jgi:hypothetical protein
MVQALHLSGPPLRKVDLYYLPTELGQLLPPWDHLPDPVLTLFSVVSYEAWEYAVNKFATPLMQQLVTPPSICLYRVSKMYPCSSKNNCVMYNPLECFPKIGMPRCFDPETNQKELSVVREVLHGWAENYYWVVIN